jgi:peptide/nickel transport system substrate-binding protein
VKSQAPDAICQVAASNINRTLGINRDRPPFDNPDLRRAMTLTLDRQAYIDILTEGQGDIGAVMMPAPEGIWGMPPDLLRTLPGYDPDIRKNRAEARRIMEKLGHGPDKRLAVTVSTRNIATYRDASVILIDQLKEIYIDGVLEPIDTVNWYPRVMRKDFTVTVNVSENSLDDPDPIFYQKYLCGAERNYTGYCNPELDQQIDRQSMESDRAKRRQLVWEIERKLAEHDARPIIFYLRGAALLASPGEGADHPGQRHLQRFALRRPVARQLNGSSAQHARQVLTAAAERSPFLRLRSAAGPIYRCRVM